MTTHQPVFEKKNIVVTGGAGFLGSHLCDLLVLKHKVICIDDFSTGREENIHHLLSNPNFEFVRHDISEPLELETLRELRAFQVPFQGVQEIYHLASPASPKDYTRLSVETLAANALGTKHVLDMAKKFGAKILLMSSGAIYGQPRGDAPFPETDWGYVDPIGVRSPYEEGKRYAEALTMAYHRRFQLETKIIRLFNTYGPRMRLNDGRLIPDLVQAALKNMPLTIHGGRKDTTSFLFITDALEGIVRMMQSHETGPMNLGNPELHTVTEVAEQIASISGARAEIRFETPFEYGSQQAIPAVRQAREMLGWFPVVPLKEGLQRTVEYMRGVQSVGLGGQSYDTAA